MKHYGCSSNNMIVDEIIWLFILNSKFKVPNAIFWYYKYPYNNIRMPNRRVCPPWLNLLHNRKSTLRNIRRECFFPMWDKHLFFIHLQTAPTDGWSFFINGSKVFFFFLYCMGVCKLVGGGVFWFVGDFCSN